MAIKLAVDTCDVPTVIATVPVFVTVFSDTLPKAKVPEFVRGLFITDPLFNVNVLEPRLVKLPDFDIVPV